MRLPRFRIRTLMIAVVIASALLFGGIQGERLWRRSAQRRAYSNSAAELERWSKRDAAIQEAKASKAHCAALACVSQVTPLELQEPLLAEVVEGLNEAELYHGSSARKLRARGDYWGVFRRNYDRVARYPWLPVPPDPAPPD